MEMPDVWCSVDVEDWSGHVVRLDLWFDRGANADIIDPRRS